MKGAPREHLDPDLAKSLTASLLKGTRSFFGLRASHLAETVSIAPNGWPKSLVNLGYLKR